MEKSVQVRQRGEALLRAGATLQAYDTVADGLRQFPRDLRLRQLLALALARTGASRLANVELQKLVVEGHADEETLGLLARTHKDLWVTSAAATERQQHLRLALEHYRAAYSLSQGYWSGINAATTALLLGEHEDASRLAAQVRAECLARLEDGGRDKDRYWLLATLGEAALVLSDITQAAAWYTQAMAHGTGRVSDLVSTRRNARLIVQQLQVDGTAIDACFPVNRVVVFAGHLIDRPGRAEPRFPPSLERPVRDAIAERLRELGASVGYASAACGGDILFLEALAERNADTHVVLPYDRDQFKLDCVEIGGGDWGDRFERMLTRATDVGAASTQRMSESRMSYEYGFLVLDGTAAVRSDELDTELVCLAVWDGKPGDGPGGTASAVEYWRKVGRRVDIIDVASLRVPSAVAHAGPTAQPAVGLERRVLPVEPEIKGLLFADASGFGKLSEDEIPLFVEHFLGLVAAELRRAGTAPVLTNTWGDGLYFVFDDVRSTGTFALTLREAVRATDWSAKGFRHDLSLRIGLHAGPVYACVDPVTGRPNYLGAHVSRAARIEPITPPGEVYASGAFAALARSEGVREFVCAYVGLTPQAKDYGTLPTDIVQRGRG